jgi:hypothetical protein
MAKNIRKKIASEKNFSYLQKDFESFRTELQLYARKHYSNKIVDFSDASLAGLFLDMAAYVGDSLSFYMDHQYTENFLETAIETDNILALIRNTGIEIAGPSAAIVDIEISLVIPATKNQNTSESIPNDFFMPVIKAGTIFGSSSGIDFTLLDDINFAKKGINGNFIADYQVNKTDTAGQIVDFVVTLTGTCTSAQTYIETIPVSNQFIPFRTLTLAKDDVTEIISVFDSDIDEYYQVKSLTQDTIFQRFENTRADNDLVQERIELIPAPKRYVSIRSNATGKTTLRFGSGNAEKFDEDIIPDPSEHAIKLYGDRKVFNTLTIDPNSFLETSTLGISPTNTKLTVTYRYGGGLSHNLSAGQINFVKTLNTVFNTAVSSFNINKIRSSIEAINTSAASGGENEPSMETMRQIAILSKNSQDRVVTREDLISRIYSMPSNFGRVFRVSVRDNPNNPLAAQLHIISRNSSNKLIISSDSLKENLAIYLSSFRLISDAIDVVDAQVINIAIEFELVVAKKFNKNTVIQEAVNNIKRYMKIENFQIDQPIIIGEIENLILNVPGVLSLIDLKFLNRNNFFQSRPYSTIKYSVTRSIDRGLIFPPRGGIFEVRYPLDDITGKA